MRRVLKFVGFALLAAWWLFEAVDTIRAQAQPERNYTLTVSPQELRHLDAAVNELPKKIADPLIVKLQAQIAAQDKAAAEAQKPEPKK